MALLWSVKNDNKALPFSTLNDTFTLKGTPITASPISDVQKLSIGGTHYFIKRYYKAGKGLRAWLGQSRIESEWLNLQRFASWGIPTTHTVAWGLEKKWGIFIRGAMVTEEIPNTMDLEHLAKTQDPRLKNPGWVKSISTQLAAYTRFIHEKNFAHNDLKWRNLLVDDQERLFFIDCPCGKFWWKPFLKRRIIKDLACLDKVAKHQLSKAQRLRFYLQYADKKKLSMADKNQIHQILQFFAGRE